MAEPGTPSVDHVFNRAREKRQIGIVFSTWNISELLGTQDLQALINYSQNNGFDPILFRATEETNEQQASRVVDMTEKLLGSLSDKRVAVLGLAFKKDTDDIREAASLRVIESLRRKGAKIVAYDPTAIPNAKKVFSEQIDYARTPALLSRELTALSL